MSIQEDVLIDLLRQVKDVLDKHNIEFWLECGTLLGAVRDGKFIPWEHDLDFGVWHEKISIDIKLSISKKLSNMGSKVYVTENYMTIKNSEETWADINFYCLVNDKAVVRILGPKNLIGLLSNMLSKILLVPYYYKIDFKKGLTTFIRSVFIIISREIPSPLRKQIAKVMLDIYEKVGSKNVSWIVPSHYFGDLAIIRFYDMEFKVPVKTHEYLTYRYGKDWHIPRKDWVTERDDGAVSIHHYK